MASNQLLQAKHCAMKTSGSRHAVVARRFSALSGSSIPPLCCACSLLFLLSFGAAPASALADGSTVLVVASVADSASAPNPGLSLANAPAPQPNRSEIRHIITQMAKKHDLDIDLVMAIVQAESAYDPYAVSTAGAIGLMQVMPETAADYGITSAHDLFDPYINVSTGTRHLSRLLRKYQSIAKAVMAYNAGEGALERSGGFVRYAETQQYTYRVISYFLKKKGIPIESQSAVETTGIRITPSMASGKAKPSSTSTKGSASPAAKPRQPITRLNSRLSPTLSRPAQSTISRTYTR